MLTRQLACAFWDFFFVRTHTPARLRIGQQMGDRSAGDAAIRQVGHHQSRRAVTAALQIKTDPSRAVASSA